MSNPTPPTESSWPLAPPAEREPELRDGVEEDSEAYGALRELLLAPEQRELTSKDHFSVDGTLIDAWASFKSFKPKDGTPNALNFSL